MNTSPVPGHLCALFTILIWGTTFISSKVLLADLSPLELILIRLVLALLALLVFYPRLLINTTPAQELTFAAAGLCGVSLYFLLENLALTRTMAANVSVIVSLSPFFLAIFSWLLDRSTPLSGRFFLGLALAMAGVVLLSFQGNQLELAPAGDLLALGAAVVWAVYSLLIKRINGFGYHIIQATRRVFFYGLCFLLPVLPLAGGFSVTGAVLARARVLLNLLYLGLGASALCFLTWNWAVKALGPLKTSVYIYLNPVVTVIAAALLLPGERLTPVAAAGILMTLAGLALSESRGRKKEETCGEKAS